MLRFLIQLVIFFGLLSLSMWQYQRGEMKAALIQQEQSALTEPFVTATFHNIAAEKAYRNLAVDGYFSDKHVLLDNQTLQGKVGYHVYTFFHPNHWEATQGLWVERGFIPLTESRDNFPTLTQPDTLQNISGTLQPISNNRFAQAQPAIERREQMLRVQKIEFERINAEYAVHSPPLVLHLEQPNTLIYAPLPHKEQYLQPERHYGYSVQWALLALTWLLLCGYYQKKGKKC